MEKKYNGLLGRFSYQDDMFQLDKDEDGKQYLKYIGTELDGSKINIPDGLTDATGMFQDSQIMSQPAIPASVVKADCMFAGCEGLTAAGNLPEGLKSANYMYAHCPSLEALDAFPKALESAQGMFDGCEGLKELPAYMPPYMKNMKYMLQGCGNLETDVHLPDGIGREVVFGDASMVLVDDLSDIPDTSVLPEVSGISKVFSAAEAQAENHLFEVATEEPSQQMTQEERLAMLETLHISGMDSAEKGLGLGE